MQRACDKASRRARHMGAERPGVPVPVGLSLTSPGIEHRLAVGEGRLIALDGRHAHLTLNDTVEEIGASTPAATTTTGWGWPTSRSSPTPNDAAKIDHRQTLRAATRRASLASLIFRLGDVRAPAQPRQAAQLTPPARPARR